MGGTLYLPGYILDFDCSFSSLQYYKTVKIISFGEVAERKKKQGRYD